MYVPVVCHSIRSVQIFIASCMIIGNNQPMFKLLPISALTSLLIAGCWSHPGLAVPPETFTPAMPSPTSTQTLVLSPPTPAASPTPTGTMSPTSTPEPIGCQKPPDDYTRVDISGWTLNQRTLAMLAHAQKLYGGELEITGYAITQGSYHDNGSASFGTHLGGGAVDLSIMRQGTYIVL